MRSMIRTSRASMCSIAAAACLCSTVSWAQDYPTKPVRYVIPFPAGSGNDIVGRVIAERLTHLWGQQVIVINRDGASGSIGAAFVAKSGGLVRHGLYFEILDFGKPDRDRRRLDPEIVGFSSGRSVA